MGVERPIAGLAKSVFLRAERRLNVEYTKERSLYAMQVERLSQPETAQQEIALVRGLVTKYFPTPLNQADFISMAPTKRGLYNNFDRQAVYSDHNIPHATIVAALTTLDITRNHSDAPDLHKLQKRAWISGIVHDVKRRGDVLGSIPPFTRLHGMSAARQVHELVRDLGVTDMDAIDLRHIENALRHHDIDLLPRHAPHREELDSLKTVDRSTLGRLFESEHALVKVVAGGLAAKRMRAYVTGEVDPEYWDALIRISGAADILTRKAIHEVQGDVSAEQAYQTTLDILTSFGIFSSPSNSSKLE